MSLAISNSKQAHSSIVSMCSWYSEVDPAILRHGEPHVVRVGVICNLVPTVHQKIFLVSRGSYLSEDLEVVIRSPVAISTKHSSMDEHFPGIGGDDAGDGVGDSTSMLQV